MFTFTAIGAISVHIVAGVKRCTIKKSRPYWSSSFTERDRNTRSASDINHACKYVACFNKRLRDAYLVCLPSASYYLAYSYAIRSADFAPDICAYYAYPGSIYLAATTLSASYCSALLRFLATRPEMTPISLARVDAPIPANAPRPAPPVPPSAPPISAPAPVISIGAVTPPYVSCTIGAVLPLDAPLRREFSLYADTPGSRALALCESHYYIYYLVGVSSYPICEPITAAGGTSILGAIPSSVSDKNPDCLLSPL